MSLSAKARRAPLRAVTGAFILSSGLGKLKADEAHAKQLHGFATGTYGFLGKIDPKLFAKGLGAGEMALGAVVLAPFVSPVVAGAGLVGFSGALLNLYWNTPGMHQDGNPLPTESGVPVAKDVWMFGIGAGLIADGLLAPAHDKHVELSATVSEKRAAKSRRAKRKAKKAARKAHKTTVNLDLAKHAGELQAGTSKRAQKTARAAQKRAVKASDVAGKRLAEVRAGYGPVAAEKAKAVRDTARDLAGEYGPVAAEKAKQARDTARDLAGEYGPVAAEKAKAVRDTARDLAGEYGPVAAEKAKQARDTARDLAEEYGPVAAEKAKAVRDTAVGTAREAAGEYGPVVAKRAKKARKAARKTAQDARDRLAS